MGSKVTIKGADFTLNGIISGVLTFYNDYSDAVLQGSTTFSSANAFYILASDLSRVNLSGKTVRYVKIYAVTAGTIQIGTYSGSGTNISDEHNYQVTQGINIITLVNPITIDATHLPVFKGNGILRYWNDADDSHGWKTNRISGTASSYVNMRFPWSFGAIVAPQ